ncbi:hypothetical protein AXF42_Ash004824 [Apostasia shenzhenica]|uniref:Uncharacterized protein n=1 Tax=Apostasia shenzhenica TaxID=1088818 RepID=A0A2I0B7N9_9ASPA|nr:hypothetical protein AXF42_Ash004824 [Apostasia shenzhenica]
MYLQWGKSCETLKSANLTSSDSRIGPVSLRAKDIQFQYETNSNKMDCFLNHSSSSFSSNVSEHVLPLQSLTNENYWICNATGSGSSAASHVAHGHPPLPEHTQGNMFQQRMGGVESISTNLTGAYLNHIDFKGRGALPCNAVVNSTCL